METGVSRNQIISELGRSAHGKLAEYGSIIKSACEVDPEFVARLIAWDFTNGQIKDSKIALPVLTLASREFPEELIENSLAHLAMQPPRELMKAMRFSIESGTVARRQRMLEKMIRRYLGHKEEEPGKWSRLAVRHRRSLKSLYSLTRCPCPPWVGTALFGGSKVDGQQAPARYAPGSIFADIATLGLMEPQQAAAVIQKWHLSPLIVSGAMTGAKAKQDSSVVVQATMEQMSDTEVVTRAKSLEKKGAARDAGLKETFRKKVSKATASKKATLKTGVAAEEVEDESLKEMLRELQERQIQTQKDAGRGISGSWLVIVDKSQSQEIAIELGKHVAAAIAKFVTGRVWLAFCDASAAGSEVTGLSLEEIQQGTRFVRADNSTSYGVGLSWAVQNRHDLDGVVIVGDGGENTPPFFSQAHEEYLRMFGKSLPVYFYQTYCDPRYSQAPGGDTRNFERIMSGEGVRSGSGYSVFQAKQPIAVTKFDLTHGQVDYYSIPNLVQQMNANTFGLIDKIMACPLVTLDMVLPVKEVAACR